MSHDDKLTADEARALGAAADDFELILRFIERNRLMGQAGVLQDQHIQRLDDMIGLAARIQARFHYASLRLPERSTPSP
jgi:hypothetical protein